MWVSLSQGEWLWLVHLSNATLFGCDTAGSCPLFLHMHVFTHTLTLTNTHTHTPLPAHAHKNSAGIHQNICIQQLCFHSPVWPFSKDSWWRGEKERKKGKKKSAGEKPDLYTLHANPPPTCFHTPPLMRVPSRRCCLQTLTKHIHLNCHTLHFCFPNCAIISNEWWSSLTQMPHNILHTQKLLKWAQINDGLSLSFSVSDVNAFVWPRPAAQSIIWTVVLLPVLLEHGDWWRSQLDYLSFNSDSPILTLILLSVILLFIYCVPQRC